MREAELADRDLVRDHDLDRDLLERCHLLLTLQAAHLLLLLLTALVAERLGALIGLLGELSASWGLGLHALRLCVDQLIDMVVVLASYVAGAARIDAVHLLDLGGSRSLRRRFLGRLLLLLRGRLLLALGLLLRRGRLSMFLT